MNFTRDVLMNWLQKIVWSFSEILLAKLAFYKNVWATLLIFLNTGRFVQMGSSHVHGRDESSKILLFHATFFTNKTNVRLFFTAWWQQKKRGCTINDQNTSVSLWSTSTEILLRRRKAEHKHRWRNLLRQCFGMQVVLSTWISLSLGQRSFQTDTLQRS